MRRIKHIIFGCAAVALFCFAFLQLMSIATNPIEYAVSFSSSYAASLGLDWREAYDAMLGELQPKSIRIAAEWNQIEPEPGVYVFSDLDWMMDKAKKQGAEVLLVVGQKVPRWPECYIPAWFDSSAPGAKEQFFSYLETVVARYEGHTELAAWQVENEPFIHFPFGECEKFHKEWVREEISRVRTIDPVKPIVVTDSGELGLWWSAARAGDVLGTTVYRFVQTPTGREWGYSWLPAAWYRFRARILGKSYEEFVISELQAEPWGGSAFAPERLREHIEFARHAGASKAYLWGVEWWYWMKEVQGDARYWDIAKSAL